MTIIKSAIGIYSWRLMDIIYAGTTAFKLAV
jgi:hypothetical protein